MEIKDAEELIQQLQHAHRLSVAFYRRLLPTLDNIAAKLGCEFWYWKTIENSMPCRGSTRPSNKWAWDFVPLYATSYVYWRIEGSKAKRTDIGLNLCVYIDDAYSSKKQKENGITGQPDPITMPPGKGVLRAYIFRPTVDSEHSFSELWYQRENPEIGGKEMTTVNPDMKAIGMEWPLAELLCDSQKVIDQLKPFVEASKNDQ